MPHKLREMWDYYTEPSHLALYLGLLALLLLSILLYSRHSGKLRFRLRCLNLLLLFHFLFWSNLAYSLFLFLESAHEGDPFTFIEYSFSGLRVIVGLPILLAFSIAGVTTLLLGRRLQRSLLRRMVLIPVPPTLATTALRLARRAGLKPVQLKLEATSAAYSLTLYGRPPVIVVTRGMMKLLAPRELLAVLAHEVAHIAHRDCFYKLYTSVLARFFYFDPFTRRLRSSLCRDREFLADEAAARLTRHPLDLATALLKLSRSRSERPASPLLASSLSLCVIGGARAATLPILGSRSERSGDHPPLRARVRRLLELHMELGSS